MSSNLVDDGIVIVIDMIKDFLNPGEEFVVDAGRDMYPKMRELLAFAREQKMPIIHAVSQGMTNSHLDRFWWQIRDGVSLIPGSDGVSVVDALRPAAFSAYELYLPKWKYSAFYCTKLDVILSNPPFRGRRSIIITGMATNFCCLCTTIDAFNRDYDVIFVDDLNCTFDGIDGTPAETMHRVTVETLKQGYAAEVIQSSKLMARLTTITKPGVDDAAHAPLD